ncbi:glycosyltransferase family 2 protein [Acetobacter senegalensis]|uniref:glycosyltransferase family 2 protein n=1 Tax=Acetobacter senegalensis TaxID=446692 RepID=UPI001EDA8E72|nr:glycosyltransferase family 2 protein [Acetobacter senegalensis]MCG4271958.1 glycosyltransferase family 2 protein [Acetobacter senegalensis]
MGVAIVACAANENLYINEWISYHLRLGFDHIYLYCNDSEPDLLYKTVLPWIDLGCLTFHHHGVPGDQHGMYKHYLHVYRMRDEWVTFLDVDEFYAIRETYYIKDFLESRSEYDCIYFNWLMFGDSNYEENASGLVLDNYTRRAREINTTFKVIVKTQKLDVPFMMGHPSPYQHGIGRDEWRFDPFGGDKSFLGVDVLGNPISNILESQEDYIRKNSEKIIWTASVCHFYLKSRDHYKKRSERGKVLGPGWELEWTKKLESGEYIEEMKMVNEVHDTWLQDRNSMLSMFGNKFVNVK